MSYLPDGLSLAIAPPPTPACPRRAAQMSSLAPINTATPSLSAAAENTSSTSSGESSANAEALRQFAALFPSPPLACQLHQPHFQPAILSDNNVSSLPAYAASRENPLSDPNAASTYLRDLSLVSEAVRRAGEALLARDLGDASL
ncbi:MAG: hypothetical protein M1829_006212 [Trizodia sp. TS-e1964]|nr:MAG: hypothetical protein M1829_006212 [Trizodia sp. TS-e1964]